MHPANSARARVFCLALMVNIDMENLLNMEHAPLLPDLFNNEHAPLLPVVDGMHVQIEPRALLRTVGLGLGMVVSGCCGGLEEAYLITQHDLDPLGATFEANARHWFSMWVVGMATFGVFKILFWVFRAPQ